MSHLIAIEPADDITHGRAMARIGLGLFALACGTASLPANADVPPDNTTLSLRFLDYQDSQPGNERIRVRAPALAISMPLAGDWSFDGSVVSDVISGASPAFYSATRSFSQITDHRLAVDANVTKYLPDGSLKVGVAVSSESDYDSRAVSALASFSTDDRNTALKLGVGLTKDLIRSNVDSTLHETRSSVDWLLGITRVLSATDIAQLTVTYANGQGFFSDPYKALDNRPRSRQAGTVLARWNHFFVGSDATARMSYRYYADTNNIHAHTVQFEYEQPLAYGWALTPLLRVYSQSAASYFVAPNLNFPTRINIPVDFVPGESLISFDQRASSFGGSTWGIKVAKELDKNWSVDVKIERYEQRAAWRWGGEGTPGLDTFVARTWQIGLSRRL